jgi:hypothetical protein
MKTKDLIKQLQECDPEGETEVCVHNVPIYYVDNLPAYYDGKLQVLINDPEKEPYYSVVGAKFVSTGRKVVINTLGIDDAIHSDPDLPVEIDNDIPTYDFSYAKRVEEWRKEARDIKEHMGNLKKQKAEGHK